MVRIILEIQLTVFGFSRNFPRKSPSICSHSKISGIFGQIEGSHYNTDTSIMDSSLGLIETKFHANSYYLYNMHTTIIWTLLTFNSLFVRWTFVMLHERGLTVLPKMTKSSPKMFEPPVLVFFMLVRCSFPTDIC